VGQELRGFDSADTIFDQLAEFPALIVGDCGSQVLDLD
jgi:hypothetical protein